MTFEITMSRVPIEKSAKTQTAVPTDVGRVFHNLGADTGNARSPNVAQPVNRTSSDEVSLQAAVGSDFCVL